MRCKVVTVKIEGLEGNRADGGRGFWDEVPLFTHRMTTT